MVYYADTSVLAKRHLEEIGRTWVRLLTKPAANNTIFTAQISLVELYSALNRQLRKKSFSNLRYSRLSSVVSRIWNSQYLTVSTTAQVLEIARQFVELHPLKAYDAVQLASAIRVRQTMPPGSPPITFLSADNQLLSAAVAEGFSTDNPNLH
ncbi:MAG: type II toxin-antitoxin system VapC family toxin [Acidobacteriota bacterium]